jgi:hypothetical protein
MRNEQEYLFGRSLQQLVAHLIKNAIKVPEPILKGALDFEASAWDSQDAAAKRERVRAIADLTEAPSAIHRHMEAYPHAFSKKRYADYLTALKFYKESLGL